jgi:rod shape determining protein RodA
MAVRITAGRGRPIDLALLTAASLLVLVGLARLLSLSLNNPDPDYSLFLRQLLFVAGSGTAAFFVSRLDYRILGGIHWWIYGFGLLSLIAVRLLGTEIRGTTGWFEFGWFQLQPVELVKVILAIVLAKFFADRLDRLQTARTFFLSGLVMLGPVILVGLQPDLGSAAILVGIWLGMVLVLPVRKILLIGLASGLIVFAAVSWQFFLQPYQHERILSFVQPERDPLGAGYNVRQAVTAVGAGQIFGRGLGLGTQSRLGFVPERHTDFIFASIAEELGFVGSVVMIGLFGVVFWRMMRMIRQTSDPYSTFLCLAIGLMFFIQTSINIAMNLGLFPVTGIPLPLVSYGGSSMLASIIAIGLLESVVIHQPTRRST